MMAKFNPTVSDLEAEQKLIAAVLDDGRNLRAVAAVKPETFSRSSHQVVWRAILALHRRKEAVTQTTLLHELEETYELEDIGGEDGLLAILAAPMSMSSDEFTEIGARGLARVVLELQVRRLGRTLADGYESHPDRWSALASVREEIDNVQSLLRSGAFDGSSDSPANRAQLPILSVRELLALPPAQGIIGDILFEDSIAFLYGDSDTWKTFLALSWGLSVATGSPWLAKKVKRGAVVYVAAEGGRGIGPRVNAWLIAHGLQDSDADFYTVAAEVNLLSDENVGALIGAIRDRLGEDHHTPVLIVFDTLARSMGGADENGTAEGNRVTSAANLLKRELGGACVLILHHDGKDPSRGMRGSSTYRNNADTVIKVRAPKPQEGQRREPGSPVTLHSEKAKDATNFVDYAFTTTLQRWATEDGELRESLVVCASDAQPEGLLQPPTRSLTANQIKALLALPLDGALTNTEWQKQSGLAERTFQDARKFHESQGHVEQAPHEGDKRRKWYQLTEKGADLRKRRRLDATAPAAGEVGATRTSAPNEPARTPQPEFSRIELPAADLTPYSVPAVSQPSVTFGEFTPRPIPPGQQATWVG
jgi:DNA-binding MarR family transcriptional regulator